MIDLDNQRGEHLFVLRQVEHCRGGRLAEALMGKATDPTLKPNCVGGLLEYLVKHHAGIANRWVKTFVTTPVRAEGRDRALALEAATALALYACDGGRDMIWPAVQQDPQWGEEWVAAV